MGFEVRKLTEEEQKKLGSLIEKDLGNVQYSLGRKCAIDLEKSYCLIRYGGEGTYKEEQRDYMVFVYNNRICRIVLTSERIDPFEKHYKVFVKFYKLEIQQEFKEEENEILELIKAGLWAINKAGESGILVQSHLDEIIYDESELKFGEIKRWE